MKGLELSERYYRECGAPEIHRLFAAWEDRIAVGLAGDGSECFGFDDALSSDHDFGPRFVLWLTEEDASQIGAALQELYDSLPESYLSYRRPESDRAAGRSGVMRIGDFYRRYTGCPDAPARLTDWLRIPEHLLAAATNGQVFTDALGEFSRIRSQLLLGYPQDVKRKKLAARLFAMAQAGQYNYPRMCKRGDPVAAHLALDNFVRSALSAAYLLNDRYAPYYKWLYRGACELPVLGDTARELKTLYERDEAECIAAIEAICAQFVRQLQEQALTGSYSPFLVDHAEEVRRRIHDSSLRAMEVGIG